MPGAGGCELAPLAPETLSVLLILHGDSAALSCAVAAGLHNPHSPDTTRCSPKAAWHRVAPPRQGLQAASSLHAASVLTGCHTLWLQVFNMQAPQQVFKDIESPLKYQTRCITCFPDSTGYMVGRRVLFVQKSH